MAIINRFLIASQFARHITPTTATNGVDTVFEVTPFVTGTLEVFRDQSILLETIDFTETTPASGRFTLNVVPDADEAIRASYIRA